MWELFKWAKLGAWEKGVLKADPAGPEPAEVGCGFVWCEAVGGGSARTDTDGFGRVLSNRSRTLVLPSRTGSNRVAPGPTESHRVLPSRTGSNRVAPGPTESRRVQPSRAGSYQVAPGPTKSHRVLPSCTGSYQVAPGPTKSHRVLPSCTGSYQVAPGPVMPGKDRNED